MNTIFENISTVYQNLRGLINALENETGARMCVTICSREEFDEGICILDGTDSFLRRFGIRDYEVIEIPDEFDVERCGFGCLG